MLGFGLDLSAGSSTRDEDDSRREPEALATAEGLSREFGAPVALLDPTGPHWLERVGALADSFPTAVEGLAAVRASGLFARGSATIWRAVDTRGPIWLALPVTGPSDGDLVAIAGFAAGPIGSATPPWGPSLPEPALRAWGQSVADRLRAEAVDRLVPEESQGSGRRELPLFDRLTRRLRVSDPPERFQKLATTALREALGVAVVAWVPSSSREPVIVAGELAGLDAEGYRDLRPKVPGETVRIVNRPEGPVGAPIRRFTVVAADVDSPSGWLVAVNPMDGRPFTIPEIELLQPVASLVDTQRSNARLYADLKDLLVGVIRALTSAIDAKDPYTSGHSERVARIAVRLGEALGMSANQRSDLYLMGLLHDVGKIGIDDSVLKKCGPLTREEYLLIQSHVKIGVHILSDLKKLHHLLPGVAHHHENLNGTGYPSGLAGDAIPLEARILAVADAFDAMSSSRPYRQRLSNQQIDDNFRKGAGVQWDPQVVDALFGCRTEVERIRQKGLGESLRQVVNATLGRN